LALRTAAAGPPERHDWVTIAGLKPCATFCRVCDRRLPPTRATAPKDALRHTAERLQMLN